MTAIRTERIGGTDRMDPEPNGTEKFSPDRRATENFGDIDKAVTAFEGEIRDFVRRDVSIARRPRTEMEAKGEPVADNLNALIRRVSGVSIEEIDSVIAELQSIRDMLRQEGDRVSREIAGYASLSHAAMTAVKVIGDSLKEWKSTPSNSGKSSVG